MNASKNHANALRVLDICTGRTLDWMNALKWVGIGPSDEECDEWRTYHGPDDPKRNWCERFAVDLELEETDFKQIVKYRGQALAVLIVEAEGKAVDLGEFLEKKDHGLRFLCIKDLVAHSVTLPKEVSGSLLGFCAFECMNLRNLKVEVPFRELRLLQVVGSKIPDLNVVKQFPFLEHVGVAFSECLSSLAGLKNCPRLREVFLSNNPLIRNLDVFSAPSHIRKLSLQGVQKVDLSPCEAMTGLEWLNLQGCHLQDSQNGLENITVLKSFKSLKFLDVRGTGLSAVQVKEVTRKYSKLSEIKGVGHAKMENEILCRSAFLRGNKEVCDRCMCITLDDFERDQDQKDLARLHELGLEVGECLSDKTYARVLAHLNGVGMLRIKNWIRVLTFSPQAFGLWRKITGTSDQSPQLQEAFLRVVLSGIRVELLEKDVISDLGFSRAWNVSEEDILKGLRPISRAMQADKPEVAGKYLKNIQMVEMRKAFAMALMQQESFLRVSDNVSRLLSEFIADEDSVVELCSRLADLHPTHSWVKAIKLELRKGHESLLESVSRCCQHELIREYAKKKALDAFLTDAASWKKEIPDFLNAMKTK